MKADNRGGGCWCLFGLIAVVLLVVIAATPAFGQKQAELDKTLDRLYNTQTKEDQLHLMWLGKHQVGDLEGFASAGYLLKTSNNVVLIDSSSLLDDHVDSMQKLDLILVTHIHGDHFIADSAVSLHKKTGAKVVANTEAYSELKGQIPEDKLVEMPPLETKHIKKSSKPDDNIKVHSFLAQHPVQDPVVYLIEVDGFRVFHGADSGYVESLKQLKDIEVHVSLVPTGDPSPSASPDAAYRMIQATSPYVAYTMHGSESQNKELASMVQGDDSLSTSVVIPEQYEIITPTGVVPEFEYLALVIFAALSSAVVLVIYGQKRRQTVFKKN